MARNTFFILIGSKNSLKGKIQCKSKCLTNRHCLKFHIHRKNGVLERPTKKEIHYC
jgi:hypothetical protein